MGRVLVRCCCLKVEDCISDSLVSRADVELTPSERKAPLECLVNVFSKAETSTAARGHPPAASQATQPANLNAISMASYDRTIFDFDQLHAGWTCATGSLRMQTRLGER
ncbi:hypothetical protein EDB86DRAFT_3083726 [Lactarius hatsudake]|nr:hypothetical protein EDB86DRAFT_3083726 [Lactarius hatsudake]